MLLAAFFGLMAAATAAWSWSRIERFQVREYSFSDLTTFANATAHTTVRITHAPAFTGEIFNISHNINNLSSTNVAWVGDEHIELSAFEVAVGTSLVASATLRSLDGQIGYTTLSWDREQSSIIENGQHVLRLVGVGGSGGVGANRPYIEELRFEGDWSSPGSHAVHAINAAWAIEADFVFDGTYTVFRARNNQFVNDGLHELDLTLSLYGVAAIPEPAGHVLMLAGLGVVAVLRRWKR